MPPDRLCQHAGCDKPALFQYDRCPRHLRDIDAMQIDEPTAARLAAVYELMYEDYEEADESRVYELVEKGFEVASWRTDETGAGHFAMVRAD
jgi:hypothetical protein